MKGYVRIFQLYKGHSRAVLLGIVGTILCSINELVYPYITKYVIGNILNIEDISAAINELVLVAVMFAVSHGAYMIGYYIQIVHVSHLVDLIRADLRNKLFWKLEHLSFKWYDNNRTGEIMAILGGDVDRIDWMSWSLISEFLGIIIQLIGAIVIFGSMNLKLTMMIVPMIPIVLIAEKIFYSYMKPKYKMVRELARNQLKFEEDKIAGVRTIQSFNKEIYEYDKFAKINDELNEVSKIKWKTIYVHKSLNNTISTFFFCLVIISGSAMVLKGEVSLADLLIFNMYSYMLTNPARMLADYVKEYTECKVSYDKVMDLMNTKEDITSCNNPVKSKITGNIQFNDVSFSYNENDTVLNSCNLQVKAGEYVAIVGPSGAGKSTIAGLIPRYYDIINGSITIDGINIKDYSLGYLRRNIGVVQQDIYLFAGTVYENISYAVGSTSMEDVIEAAKLANCHEFISKLPDGYNTDIGERGVKLSGGQKQRIAIARLFLLNPPILIFDEATSALDNESERVVQKALENLAKNRTTIVIAHRLSTIQNADRILFLSENGIEEEGTHEELMELGGSYAKLYRINGKTTE